VIEWLDKEKRGMYSVSTVNGEIKCFQATCWKLNESSTVKVPGFVGPCPHRDKDYHRIGSNFWKFYLIRTSFTLNEMVSLVMKVFWLFRLEGIVLVLGVGRCTTSYLLVGPVCFVMPCCFLLLPPSMIAFLNWTRIYNLVIKSLAPEYHHRLFGWTWGFRKESFSMMIFKYSFLMTLNSTLLG
jgi:hypothetical protein